MVVVAWDLPHGCESAEVAALLAGLSRKQRRVLREYVWRVELGELGVMAWLADARCPVSEGVWYRSAERGGHYWGCVAFQAALERYMNAALGWQTREEARAVASAQRSLRMAAPRAAGRLTEIVGGDLSDFFKVIERWIEEPRPSEEILEEKVEEVERHGVTMKVRFYRVRQTVLDLEKLKDPRYARLVKKFVDSPRSGLSIELHDALRASETVLDRAGEETADKGSVGLGAAFEEALRRAYGEPDATDGNG